MSGETKHSVTAMRKSISRRTPSVLAEHTRGATPAPSRSKVVPTEDEFRTWAQHPVTEWVARQYQRMSLAQQQLWLDQSWRGGIPNPEALIELRTRADAYMAFLETGWSQYAAVDAQD